MKALFLTLALLVSSTAFARRVLITNTSQTYVMMKIEFRDAQDSDGYSEITVEPSQSVWVEYPDQVNRSRLEFISFVDGQFYAYSAGSYEWASLGRKDAALDIYVSNQKIQFVIRPL